MNRVSPPTRSGLQNEVLALFRQLLRCAKSKGGEELHRYVAQEFRVRAGNVRKFDFNGIEHAIRHGQKQLKMIKSPGFKGANAFSSGSGV